MPQRGHLLLLLHPHPGPLRVVHRAHDSEVLLQLDARAHRQRARPCAGRQGLGDADNPDCSGFTVAQLQTLDFAAMDLTEFYASLVPKSPDIGALQGANASRVNSCYFGQGKC